MISKSTKGLALSLLLASGASQAGVWAPTDGDSNFFDLKTLLGIAHSTDEFGIFEDTADTATGPKLVFTGGATISFTQNGVNWDISNGTDSSTLLGSANFQIGYNRDSVWEFESASATIALLGNSAWHLAFTGKGELIDLYAIDIEPSQAQADFPAVPLPASVWMMGSALLGLVGVGRRKKVA